MDSHLFTCCGSPAYAAPELVAGKEYVGAEVCGSFSYLDELLLITFVVCCTILFWLLYSAYVHVIPLLAITASEFLDRVNKLSVCHAWKHHAPVAPRSVLSH